MVSSVSPLSKSSNLVVILGTLDTRVFTNKGVRWAKSEQFNTILGW